jgi:glycosyltransferase 2 family protein
LNDFSQLGNILTDSQLNVIVAWRIASYHIPLIIMWIALMKLALGKSYSKMSQPSTTTFTDS